MRYIAKAFGKAIMEVDSSNYYRLYFELFGKRYEFEYFVHFTDSYDI